MYSFPPTNYRVRCKKYDSFCNALVIDFIGVYFLLQLLFIATNTQKKYCLFKEFFKIQKFLMVKLSYLYRLCSPWDVHLISPLAWRAQTLLYHLTYKALGPSSFTIPYFVFHPNVSCYIHNIYCVYYLLTCFSQLDSALRTRRVTCLS